MIHKKDEFNIFVWGLYLPKEFTKTEWEMTEAISKEASLFLRSIGYKARVHIPPPQFGAVGGGISQIIASLPNVFSFIKFIILIFTLITDRYARTLINKTQNKLSMSIEVGYRSKENHWVKSWDPANASQKISVMLDASHLLARHLAEKYPNINFGQHILFSMQRGNATQSYSFKSGEDTAFNIARYKQLARQTTFTKNVRKEFIYTKYRMIKRIDSYDINELDMGNKIYYLVLPSILIKEAYYKYQILLNKFKESNNK